MTISRRTLGKALTAAVVAGAAARPAAAHAAPALPALDPEKLSAAIARLPDAEASGALVRVCGRAGTWSGAAGISSVDAATPPTTATTGWPR